MIYSHVTQLAPENQLVNNTAIFPFGGEMSFLRTCSTITATKTK